MKDHVFEGPDVASALQAAGTRLGLPVEKLRYVVLQKETVSRLGIQGTPARIAVLLDAHRPAPSAPRPAPRPVHDDDDLEAPPAPRAPRPDPARQAEAVVRSWAQAADLDVAAVVVERDGALVVEISGPDRAELGDDVLDGLAHVLQKTLEGQRDSRRPVVVECSGRRLGRDEALQQKARLMAAEVRADGQPRELGPLNAYERRLVHMAVREQAGVTSYSVGEGSERRVTVAVLPPGGGTEVM